MRRDIFKSFLEESDCSGMTYAKDIEPWIGERAAFGAVDLGGKTPVPVVVLAQTDKGKAEDAVAALTKKCDDLDDFGATVSDDFVVVADSVANAKKIVADADKSGIADSEGYKDATGEVGDVGHHQLLRQPEGRRRIADLIADEAPSGARAQGRARGADQEPRGQPG